ncbi:MAG: hypothetical protein ACX939_11115 [Hyphococcus sp.]
MIRKSLTSLSVISLATLAAGCGDGDDDLTILDAADIYRSNQAVFASIRIAYPGPYTEFTRLPARDPAKQTRGEALFLKSLRESFPVEFVDFLPLSEAGKDEIDVVLTRYGLNADYTMVSIVYSDIALAAPASDPNAAVFEACDARALDWFDKDRGESPVSVFCRLDDNWYAYQRVL